ncbi:hypothetical protein A5844_000316 [Enterococcus sp. 10A9_DIV0425]|uniref:Uncharacterized protein n=1 Tax=Candidatus Enterococcus wittei TaxID=1987383 RepID=A0A2C9XPJ9_9ENTE|nr:hypothetical protein A5844_000316 [Enterococcus sp. 10A9_DIV0425]
MEEDERYWPLKVHLLHESMKIKKFRLFDEYEMIHKRMNITLPGPYFLEPFGRQNKDRYITTVILYLF